MLHKVKEIVTQLSSSKRGVANATQGSDAVVERIELFS